MDAARICPTSGELGSDPRRGLNPEGTDQRHCGTWSRTGGNYSPLEGRVRGIRTNPYPFSMSLSILGCSATTSGRKLHPMSAHSAGHHNMLRGIPLAGRCLPQKARQGLAPIGGRLGHRSAGCHRRDRRPTLRRGLSDTPLEERDPAKFQDCMVWLYYERLSYQWEDSNAGL
jgi:hypothetical protein